MARKLPSQLTLLFTVVCMGLVWGISTRGSAAGAPGQGMPANVSGAQLVGQTKGKVNACTDQSANSASLQLESPADPALVSIDNAGNGTVTLILKNVRSEALALATGSLTITDFCHKPLEGSQSGYFLNSQALLTGVPTASVDGGKDFPLKIVFTQVWETGESVAQLNIGAETICNLHAVKQPVPFAIQIDGQNTEAVFGPGEAPSVILTNADRASYAFKWSLLVPGRSPTKEAHNFIPPNSKLSLDLSQSRLGGSFFSAGLLRDEVLDGVLQLQPDVTDGMPPQPAKQLPLKLRLRFWPTYFQQTINIILTALLVLIGMCASLAFRYFLPSTAVSVRIRRDITDMKRRLDGIDENLPTQPHTVLEATIESCRHKLQAIPLFSPGAPALLRDVQANVAMCSAWIDCAYSVAEILAEALRSLQSGLSPTLMRMIEEKCDQALHPFLSGFTKPEELQAMAAAAGDARKYLEAAINEDPIPDLEAVLKKRVGLLGPDSLESLLAAYPKYGGLFKQASQILGKPSASTYRDFDILTLKCILLMRYRDLALRVGAAEFPLPPRPEPVTAVTAPAPKTALERMQLHYDRFLAYVDTESYESLNMARVLLTEMEQDFYPEALTAELAKAPPALEIISVPSPVEPGVPVHYSLRFVRAALNHVAAVQEWSLIWRFQERSEGQAETTAETAARAPETQSGWDIYHRFESEGKHRVSVDIYDIDGNKIPTSQPITYSVEMQTDQDSLVQRKWYRPFGSFTGEAWIEGLRMALVLFIALAGVFTVARDTAAKGDLFQSAAALIGIGFAADIVKSAISDKAVEAK